MIEKERLLKTVNAYNIEINQKQLEQFAHYAELLLEWNLKINLTTITEQQEIENKHFLDSLLFASQPEIQGKIVDVGSGAGFPGMATKIYRPDLAVTLLEPTGKRVKFLQEVSRQLGLGLDVIKERAEEAARKQWRETFQVATARAVAALPVLCEYCLPLVQPGGVFIAMKGAEVQQEIEQSSNAIHKLGGKLKDTRYFKLPDGSRRCLVLIEKDSKTPAIYPRNGGVIAKRPL